MCFNLILITFHSSFLLLVVRPLLLVAMHLLTSSMRETVFGDPQGSRRRTGRETAHVHVCHVGGGGPGVTVLCRFLRERWHGMPSLASFRKRGTLRTRISGDLRTS